jgi:hypothetical protein
LEIAFTNPDQSAARTLQSERNHGFLRYNETESYFRLISVDDAPFEIVVNRDRLYNT